MSVAPLPPPLPASEPSRDRRESGNVVSQGFAVEGPRLIAVRRFGDHRGYFMETYSRRDFEAVGVADAFVQDNQSLSVAPGTLRGMHFQLAPRAQAKLVRVIRGAVLDVVVDIRRASPTFGRHVAVALTEEGGEQFFVPAGFAHGFVTLRPDTVIAYKVSDTYDAALDRGLAWDDPDLALPWPDFAALGCPGGPTLSDKDRRHPRLRDLPDAF